MSRACRSRIVLEPNEKRNVLTLMVTRSRRAIQGRFLFQEMKYVFVHCVLVHRGAMCDAGMSPSGCQLLGEDWGGCQNKCCRICLGTEGGRSFHCTDVSSRNAPTNAHLHSLLYQAPLGTHRAVEPIIQSCASMSHFRGSASEALTIL